MDLAVQWSLIVLGVSSAVAATALVVGLLRLLPVLERTERVLGQTRRTLAKVNRIAGDVELATQDARRLESRLAGLAGHLVDNLEGPVRLVSALVTGTSAGLSSLLGARASRHRDGTRDRRHHERTGAASRSAEGGETDG